MAGLLLSQAGFNHFSSLFFLFFIFAERSTRLSRFLFLEGNKQAITKLMAERRISASHCGKLLAKETVMNTLEFFPNRIDF